MDSMVALESLWPHLNEVLLDFVQQKKCVKMAIFVKILLLNVHFCEKGPVKVS